MQLTSILVAALSASTLTSALPTDLNSTDPFPETQEAEHSLQKRDSFGWIGSFKRNDGACNQGMYGKRPPIHNAIECVKFKATTQRVGINWGTGMYSFYSLGLYSDTDCKQMVGHIEGPKEHRLIGPQSCVNPLHFSRGQVWRSVKITGIHTSPASGQPMSGTRRPRPLDIGYGIQ